MRMAEKKCSPSLVIREKQIKILRFHLIPAKINETNYSSCSGILRDKRKHTWLLLVGVQIFKATMEIKMDVPWEAWHRSTSNPAILLLGINPKDSSFCWRDTYSSMFTTSLFKITRNCKESRHPLTDEWILKMYNINDCFRIEILCCLSYHQFYYRRYTVQYGTKEGCASTADPKCTSTPVTSCSKTIRITVSCMVTFYPVCFFRYIYQQQLIAHCRKKLISR